MWSPSRLSDSGSRWPPSVPSGPLPLIAFGLAFTLWALASNSIATWLWGQQLSLLERSVWNVPSGIIQLGLSVLVLKYEGVRLRDIGLARGQFLPALVATVGVLIVVNVVLAGLGTLDQRPIAVGIYEYYQSPPQNYSLSIIAIGGLSTYLFTGPAEELAFRGYIQNKLIALLGDTSARLRIATGIVLTGVAFALIHIPTLVLLDGLAPAQAVGTLTLLAVSGIVFGTIYALTHNLFLVMFLHGVGNFWPLVVDPGAGTWPNYGVILVVYLLLVAVYRYWVLGSAISPRAGTTGTSE